MLNHSHNARGSRACAVVLHKWQSHKFLCDETQTTIRSMKSHAQIIGKSSLQFLNTVKLR